MCRLKKDLYGLKKAPRTWYGKIDSFLMSLGFTKSKVDPNLYYKVVDGDQVILLLYMDGMFLMGEEKFILDSKRKLDAEFEMKYLSMMHYFLGLEVWKKPGEIMLSQGNYVVEILKRFRMMNCKSMSMLMMMNLKLLGDTTSETFDATLYGKMIGSLMYLMNMRPYICFAMNTLRQYMVQLRHVHLNAAKHVLRYLKGTIDYGLQYVAHCKFVLVGYIDLDWAGSVID